MLAKLSLRGFFRLLTRAARDTFKDHCILQRLGIMYAIIETGGKQHRVAPGQTLTIEKLEVDAGSTVDFDRVLMVGSGEQIKFGVPLVTGAKVEAVVIKHGRGDKIRIIKFRRRKHHMKHQGHRQYFTQVKITSIQ